MTLREILDRKISTGEKIVSIYIPAGYPTLEATVPLLRTLANAGADLVELGVPFSDPLADGPTIQKASQQALDNGITLEKILSQLEKFRQESDLPVILMGYANPFLQFGFDRLARRAAACAVAGFIIPDLPLEECSEWKEVLSEHGLDLIYLATPNTTSERLITISAQTTRFIYAVSLTGVTGARQQLPAATRHFLQRLRGVSAHPLLVGFGISGVESARKIAPWCDGVIVGSAAINQLTGTSSLEEACAGLARFVRTIKDGITAPAS